MHAKLRITLTAAALVAAVPAAGVASAHDGQRGGRGPGEAEPGHGGKHHAGKPGKGCERGRGKGYEAKGTLAAGSSLEQVEGADTPRRADDRFSGTVIVQVRQGNRRGRQDRGLTSYAVDHVRALGTADGAGGPLPPVGSRVLLVGTIAKAACPVPAPPTDPAPSTNPAPSTSPSPSPSPTPAPNATASRASFDDDATDEGEASDAGSRGSRGGGGHRPGGPKGDDPAGDGADAADDDGSVSGDDSPSSTTPVPASADAAASAATIRLIVFKGARRPER